MALVLIVWISRPSYYVCLAMASSTDTMMGASIFWVLYGIMVTISVVVSILQVFCMSLW